MSRQAVPFDPVAIAGYRSAGWRITEHRRPDSGVTTGPCGRCQRPCHRYGPQGQPFCDDCAANVARSESEDTDELRTWECAADVARRIAGGGRA